MKFPMNRTRDLPVCRTVPQSTAPPLAPLALCTTPNTKQHRYQEEHRMHGFSFCFRPVPLSHNTRTRTSAAFLQISVSFKIKPCKRVQQPISLSSLAAMEQREILANTNLVKLWHQWAHSPAIPALKRQ